MRQLFRFSILTTCLVLLCIAMLSTLHAQSSGVQPTPVAGSNSISYNSTTQTYSFLHSGTVRYEYTIRSGVTFNGGTLNVFLGCHGNTAAPLRRDMTVRAGVTELGRFPEVRNGRVRAARPSAFASKLPILSKIATYQYVPSTQSPSVRAELQLVRFSSESLPYLLRFFFVAGSLLGRSSKTNICLAARQSNKFSASLLLEDTALQ